MAAYRQRAEGPQRADRGRQGAGRSCAGASLQVAQSTAHADVTARSAQPSASSTSRRSRSRGRRDAAAGVQGDGHRRRAAPRRRARRARRPRARPGRGGVRAARAGDVALPRRLGALAAQPRRRHRRREPRSRPGRRARARGPRATGGRFDPTVHDAVVAAGYDRTFDAVAPDAPAAPAAPPARCGGGVRVDGHDDRARARASTSTSAGSARATRSTASPSCSPSLGPCLVNAGGDLAVRGGSWPVGVTDDAHARADARRDRHLRPRPPPLAPGRRGAAPPDRPLDRAARRPATLVRVTVVAGSAAEAEVAAKAAFLGARRRPPARASSPPTGSTVLAGGLA